MNTFLPVWVVSQCFDKMYIKKLDLLVFLFLYISWKLSHQNKLESTGCTKLFYFVLRWNWVIFYIAIFFEDLNCTSPTIDFHITQCKCVLWFDFKRSFLSAFSLKCITPVYLKHRSVSKFKSLSKAMIPAYSSFFIWTLQMYASMYYQSWRSPRILFISLYVYFH